MLRHITTHSYYRLLLFLRGILTEGMAGTKSLEVRIRFKFPSRRARETTVSRSIVAVQVFRELTCPERN